MNDKVVPIVGQRWARVTGAQFEIENINHEVVYLRVIKGSAGYLLGDLEERDMYYIAREENGWFYLQGQDKPV